MWVRRGKRSVRAHPQCAGVPRSVRRPAARLRSRRGQQSSPGATSRLVTRRLPGHPAVGRLFARATPTAAPRSLMALLAPTRALNAARRSCNATSVCDAQLMHAHREVCKLGEAHRSLCGHRCMHDEPTDRVALCSQWAPCTCLTALDVVVGIQSSQNAGHAPYKHARYDDVQLRQD